MMDLLSALTLRPIAHAIPPDCIRRHEIASAKERPNSKNSTGRGPNSKTTEQCAREIETLLDTMPDVFTVRQIMDKARSMGLKGYASTNSSYVIRRLRALAPGGSLAEFKLGRASAFQKVREEGQK